MTPAEKAKKQYDVRRAEGKCAKCGRPASAAGRAAYCADCAKRNGAYNAGYAARKSKET